MFTITTELIIALSIGVLLGILMACLLSRKERSDNSFWSKIFTSNSDLDSTIGIFAFTWIVTVMLFLFQDSLKDATEVGYIILAATNGLSSITGVKVGANMERSKNGG